MDKPVPNENEVLVKLRATTVTAVDTIFRKGSSSFARLATGLIRPKHHILGSEFSGEVEAVGNKVRRFKRGDLVFGDTSSNQGTYAEYLCLPEETPMETIPSNLTIEQAAAVSYGTLTALPFLRDNGKLKSGQKILIIGASGSVGSFAVQLARHMGAEVTGVCGSANEELVRSLGASQVIDYTKEDFTAGEEIYDVVFDSVGKSSFRQTKRTLKPGGVYLTTVLSVRILLNMLWTSRFGRKRAQIAFTGLRPVGERMKDLAGIKQLLEQGAVKPVIDRQYPFERIVEAHRYVDEGHKKGNVVIIVNDGSAA